MEENCNKTTDWIHQVREEIAKEEKGLSEKERVARLKKATEFILKDLHLKVRVLSEK